jgi:tight adherence protein B
MQAWVAMALPGVMLGGLTYLAPDYLDPLFHTSMGNALLGVSAVGLAIGGVWIHKICRMELMR